MRHFFLQSFYLIILFWSCQNDIDRTKPRVGAIAESVYASVTLQPDSLYFSHTAVSGIVERLFVEEGSLVQSGDKLIQISNDAPELNKQNSWLALELAKQNYSGTGAILSGIEEDIKAAQLSLTYDSINFFRQQNLWKEGVGSKYDYDTRKLKFEVSKKNLELLENQYARTKSELQTQLRQAENNYKTASIATKDYTVRSQINGRVYQLFREPGEIVSQQEPVASLGSASSFMIEMLVDEVDIASIEIGMKALVTLDAYEGQVFSAKLTRIYPQKNERTQTFTVEALFDKQPPRLYPGLSGEANIIISEKPSALIVPRNYLIDGNSVNTEDGIIKIKLGLQNMEEVEVLSGLDSTTYIYQPN